MISPEQLTELKIRAKNAFNVRDTNYRPVWQDTARFLSPSHGRFLESSNSIAMKGFASRKQIVNDASARARHIAMAGFKGGLVPHTLEWFRLGLVDEEMERWRPARIWLADVQRILYSVFSRSNFYSAIASPINEQILFGTGAIALTDHPTNALNFVPWTIGEYSIANNEFNEVDTSFRSIWRTARQLKQEFGEENLSDASKLLIKNNKADEFVIVTNALLPRRDFDPSKMDKLNMPIASIYWEGSMSPTEMLGESGFRSMPAFFPRWETIGEGPWGVDSPGLLSIADVKQLQVMDRQILQQTELVGNPPMNIPSSFKGRLSMQANAKNYVPDNNSAKVEPTFAVKPDIGAMDSKALRLEQKIERAFFNDLFLMILQGDGGAKTAYEIARRQEEKMMILGSTVERQTSELLTPTLTRSIEVLDNKGFLPEAPEELQGSELKFDFVSVLAQAQKAVSSSKVLGFFSFVEMAAAIDPEVVDKVDVDAAVDIYADNEGINPKIIISTEEADQKRSARAQAQQIPDQIEQAAGASSIAKDLSQAKTDEGNMLDSIVAQLPAA